MPIENITAYRVFIASPGGLEKERRAFRQALLLYNETDAVHDGVMFIPVGWEDTLGGVGRPQSIINDDLRKCDFAIVLLHNRWGSAPDRDAAGRYSSGTEEEFHVAMECQRDDAHPMRQVVTFFKAVAPKYLVEPNEQLTKVLEFRKRLEREKEHLFHVFDTTRSFEDLLRRHFGAWLRAIRAGASRAPVVTPVATLPGTEEAAREEIPSSSPIKPFVERAWRLANEGRLVEAEALFVAASFPSSDPAGFLAYARFLWRNGRTRDAEELLGKAVALAGSRGDMVTALHARRVMGHMLRERGRFDEAEKVYREAFEIARRIHHEEGIAAGYGNLGIVLHDRGDREGAEKLLRQALAEYERLGLDEGVSLSHHHIGLLLNERDDLDGAEAAFRKALEIDRRIERLEGVADNHDALGEVLARRGDFAGADEVLRVALRTNQQLERPVGMARSHMHLGHVRMAQDDVAGAEEMYRKARELFERMDAPERIADCSWSLGGLYERAGDPARAGEELGRALELYRRLGKYAEMLEVEADLALIGADGARSAS